MPLDQVSQHSVQYRGSPSDGFSASLHVTTMMEGFDDDGEDGGEEIELLSLRFILPIMLTPLATIAIRGI